MKTHKNTLYITSPDVHVRKQRNTFVVMLDRQKVHQAPIHSIENIVCFGFKSLTPKLMAFCAEENIGISYLTPEGRFLARVYGAQKGNVYLRKSQYEKSEYEEEAVPIAKAIVAAKVTNYRALLQRHMRNHPDTVSDAVRVAIERISAVIGASEHAETVDEVRGYEGECAALYFACFNDLITSQKDDFSFTTRSKRPPLDPTNALLSFAYAILTNDVRSALEAVGLDPQVGFLHRLREGRPSLALDIVEEFRAYMGDRVVLSLINRKQVTKDDFTRRPSGEVRISDRARKTLLSEYQRRKQEVIKHPFLGEKTTIGLLVHIQAQLLARYLRGDMSAYPPFYLK